MDGRGFASMSTDAPLVSIGFAIFNGSKYVEEAITSILGQTFKDFELIVSDNQSTDGTFEICKRYAEQDPRIRLHQNPTNIGGANNENLTFKMARGKYFRWAAHDDKLAPELLERCVEVLNRDPSVVLCHTQVIEIDAEGKVVRTVSRNHGKAERPHQRFAAMASAADGCEESYGLVRAEILRKTNMQQNYTGSDRTLLSELALYGKFFEVQEPLFYKRFHPGNLYSDWRARMAWFSPSLEGKISFPFWMQFSDYVRTIGRTPIGAYEKLRCYLYMLRWLAMNGPKMAKDVAVAVYMVSHSPEWRRKRHARENNWT